MPSVNIPLIKGDKTTVDNSWVDALPQNMYAVDKPILGASGFMQSYPGIQIAAIGGPAYTGFDRGAIWVSTEGFSGHYRVVGESLYRVIDTDAFLDVLPSLGSIPGSGLVRMAYSFNNLAIVAENKLYYYNPTDGLREITDPEVGAPIDIVFGDNVFILTDGDVVYHSDPLDEESFLPLDFGNADFLPDPSLGLGWNEDSELIVFGSLSIQHFTNIGSTNFLFRAIRQKAQKIGIASTYSKAYYGNMYFMLGGRENSQLGVYITESGASQKISSIGVDTILREFNRDDLSNSIVETVDYDGTVLCLIHLPEKYVLCFNSTIAKKVGNDSAWSVLVSYNPNEGTQENVPHRAYNYVHDKSTNRWYAGDKYSYLTARVDLDGGAQFDRVQECILYTPMVKLESLSVDNIDIETVCGDGVSSFFSTPDGDPVEDSASVFVSRTDDGRIYSQEWSKLYSNYGDYSTRFYINRFGYVRNRIGFKLRAYTRTRMSFASMKIEAS